MDHARRLAAACCALILASPAWAHEAGRPRLLTVSGEGEVKVAPDRADVSFAVEASERSLADAERQVAEGVARLLKLCESLEIGKAQVRSAQLNVSPQYDGSIVSGRPKIVGYQVSRQIEVDLRDLAKLGRLLQGAVEQGANRVHGVSFGSTKKDEHQRAALARAAEDARANADQLARTMGVKLGRLHALSSSGADGVPRPMHMEMRMKAMGGDEPSQAYQAGEMTFSAAVTAEFDLP